MCLVYWWEYMGDTTHWWKHLLTPPQQKMLKWLLYSICMIVSLTSNAMPLKSEMIQWFNMKNHNFWNVIKCLPDTTTGQQTSLNSIVGIKLLAVSFPDSSCFFSPLFSWLRNSEFHPDKTWITEEKEGKEKKGAVLWKAMELIYFYSPSHASLVFYFGRDLCIKEFWMTCCVLFHPRSFEGARTGCT